MTVSRITTRRFSLALLGLAFLVFVMTAADIRFGSDPAVHSVDFGANPGLDAFDATLAPVDPAPIKEFRVPVTHETVEISATETYEAWTFAGTVPGPAIRVRQGDRVRITLVNESPMGHSIDFHSARIPMDVAFRTIAPNDSLSFEFVARDPGAYLVHCGTPPVLLHIMQGMYLPIVVDPEDGWGTDVDRELVIVQSEWYARSGDAATLAPDIAAARDVRPTVVAFNGTADRYKDEPLQVDVGDRVRFFVVNAGPSLRSDFHIVGAVFDRVYPDGDPDHVLNHVQTYTIPAGGGAVFETVFEDGASGEGTYAFVTHAFADASKGAVGLIRVGQPELADAAH